MLVAPRLALMAGPERVALAAWRLLSAYVLATAAVLLLLIFKVLRPVFATLIGKDEKEEQLRLLEEARQAAEEMGGVVRFDENGKPVAVRVNEETGEVLGISGGAEDLLLLEAPQSYEKRLEYVQKLIDEDPKLVAQVIKTWLKDDG